MPSTQAAAIPRRTMVMSLRQIAEIDERFDIHVLFLEARLDLKLLHFLEGVNIDPNSRLVKIVIHADIDVGRYPDHLGVDQELPGLTWLLEIEPRRFLQILEQGANGNCVLLEELVLSDQDDQLLVER